MKPIFILGDFCRVGAVIDISFTGFRKFHYLCPTFSFVCGLHGAMCNIVKIMPDVLVHGVSFNNRGKIKRIAFQFTPYSWVNFEWRPASNLRRWLAVLGIIFMVSVTGLFMPIIITNI